MAQQYSLKTTNFSGGKAFGILIDLKGYAHCIYLLLTESLIVIPPGKRRSTLVFLLSLISAGREGINMIFFVIAWFSFQNNVAY